RRHTRCLSDWSSDVCSSDLVLLGDGLGDAGHAAGVVGARARLEGFELLDHVLGVLACDTRNLVLPGEPSQMAHGAQHLFGLLPRSEERRVGKESSSRWGLDT